MTPTSQTWTVPEAVRRPEHLIGAERPMLQSMLDARRCTLMRLCRGLTADQLRIRAVAPSALTLLGLIRHCTEVECAWFRRRMAGQTVVQRYSTPDAPGADFDAVDSADPELDLAAYRAEIELCDRSVESMPLGHSVVHPEWGPISLRWVYLQMIAEYARHIGHADLLRERIDGVVGVY